MIGNLTPRDRLITALDVPTTSEARRLVNDLGDSVSIYKVGLELLFAGGLDIVAELRHIRKRVFLDVKLLDIGNTVERAIATIAELGVTFVTVHGTDLKTMRAAVAGRGSGPLRLLAVTVLTNLNADDLREQGVGTRLEELSLQRACLAQEAGFDGVIASGHEASKIRQAVGPDFLIVTPGIRLPGGTTDDQERVMTPDRAIEAGADYIVVGRPITKGDDPRAVAETFTNHIRAAYTRLAHGPKS